MKSLSLIKFLKVLYNQVNRLIIGYVHNKNQAVAEWSWENNEQNIILENREYIVVF